jgi:hypothetical protein
VSNGATVGAGGYITDYIPAGTEVIGASIVQPTGTGGYMDVAPDLPTPMDNGWGAFAENKRTRQGGPPVMQPPLRLVPSYNFGVVENSILQPDQIGQASSPGAITYLHLFRPGTLGTVALNLNGLPGWGHLIYLDASCDGTVSSTEHTSAVTSLTVTATWPRESDGRLKACALEIVTSVPPGVVTGSTEYAALTAALTWQNNLAIQDSPRMTDSTTGLTAGRLLLTKTARSCGNLVGPSDPCSETYATGVNCKPDDMIEYRIEYRNTGSSLTSPDAHIVLVADPGLAVTFDLPGVILGDVMLLQPGESGFVLYRVSVK